MTNGKDFAFAAIGDTISQDGLTKREYFAAIALQGLLSNTNNRRNPIHAKEAVRLADALIKALNETP